jgi:hypothetical protein
MRCVKSFTALGAAVALLLSCGIATAQSLTPYTGVDWEQAPEPDAPVPGSTFSVYTGVATAAGTLGLLDATPPTRDDVVAFDLLLEDINNYGSFGANVTRTVTETNLPNPDGTFTMSIRVEGRNAAGTAPGDLWPSGLALGTAPATSGGFGIGLNLGAALGNDPFNFVGSTITAANLVVTQNNVAGTPISIPLNFFSPSPSNWNGILGLSLPNGATGTTIENALTLNVTYAIPEPGALAVIAMLPLGLIRRRRASR